eukprot:185707-Pyramimonas_sp.AAC.1
MVGRNRVVVSEGGECADVPDGVLHFPVEGCEGTRVEAPGRCELCHLLLVDVLPGGAEAHGCFDDVPRGLRVWERP